MTDTRGKLLRADWKGVWGWALDAFSTSAKAVVEILVDGEVVGSVLASHPRPHLTSLPADQRNCGFQLLFANGLNALTRHEIRARLAATGDELPGSPVVLKPSAQFDTSLEQTLGTAVQAAIATASAPADLEPSLRFVGERIEHLLALRQQASGGEKLPPHLAELHQRWGALLAEPPAPSPAARFSAATRRALVISEIPTALSFDDRPLLGQMASLVRLGMQVDYAPAEFLAEAVGHRLAVEATGATYRRPPFDLSVEDVLRRERGLYDVVLLHGLSCFDRYAALARHYCPRARVVFDVAALNFVALVRRGLLQQWQSGIDAARSLQLRETMAVWGADVTLTQSAFEAEALRQAVPQARVQVLGWPATATEPPLPFAQRSGVAFAGNFLLFPDLDAAMWLVQAIMPAVWEIDPDIRCRIAGPQIPPALRALARDGIVFEEQPTQAAVRAAGEARVAVVPRRGGSGLSRFAVDAMARGTPVVGTLIGLEALALPEDLAALRAREPEALADLIGRLHAEEDQHQLFAHSSLRFVAENFSASATERALLEVIGVTTAAPEPAEPVAAQA